MQCWVSLWPDWTAQSGWARELKGWARGLVSREAVVTCCVVVRPLLSQMWDVRDGKYDKTSVLLSPTLLSLPHYTTHSYKYLLNRVFLMVTFIEYEFIVHFAC